jgi:hypothetical protein
MKNATTFILATGATSMVIEAVVGQGVKMLHKKELHAALKKASPSATDEQISAAIDKMDKTSTDYDPALALVGLEDTAFSAALKEKDATKTYKLGYMNTIKRCHEGLNWLNMTYAGVRGLAAGYVYTLTK